MNEHPAGTLLVLPEGDRFERLDLVEESGFCRRCCVSWIFDGMMMN
jgi:hypothetical protein